MLGTHVEQAGSYQDAERTRFDFSHFSAMTAEELKRVEDIVNEKINEAIEVRTDIMTVDEAKRQVPWLSSARNTVKGTCRINGRFFKGVLRWYTCKEYI